MTLFLEVIRQVLFLDSPYKSGGSRRNHYSISAALINKIPILKLQKAIFERMLVLAVA